MVQEHLLIISYLKSFQFLFSFQSVHSSILSCFGKDFDICHRTDDISEICSCWSCDTRYCLWGPSRASSCWATAPLNLPWRCRIDDDLSGDPCPGNWRTLRYRRLRAHSSHQVLPQVSRSLRLPGH